MHPDILSLLFWYLRIQRRSLYLIFCRNSGYRRIFNVKCICPYHKMYLSKWENTFVLRKNYWAGSAQRLDKRQLLGGHRAAGSCDGLTADTASSAPPSKPTARRGTRLVEIKFDSQLLCRASVLVSCHISTASLSDHIAVIKHCIEQTNNNFWAIK